MKSIDIKAIDDDLVESEESFTLTLDDPENDGDVNLDDPHQLTVIIESADSKHSMTCHNSSLVACQSFFLLCTGFHGYQFSLKPNGHYDPPMNFPLVTLKRQNILPNTFYPLGLFWRNPSGGKSRVTSFNVFKESSQSLM